MPKIHDNQLVLLTEAQIEEIVAEVMQAPEMEPVFKLGVLRDQHRAEVDAATRLREQETNAKNGAVEFDRQKGADQALHDKLGDEIRLSESRAIKDAQNAKGIEEVRAIHGPFTDKVVRDYALKKLKADPEYLKKVNELELVQGRLDGYPKLIKGEIARALKLEKQANAQFKKAGEILLEIRKLEAELDAQSK